MLAIWMASARGPTDDERLQIIRNVEGFLAIFGLPTLFLVGWIAAWASLRRAPLWGFAVASALSAASIMLAWAVSARGAPPAGEGERSAIAFYGLFINGITGLLCVGVLAIATAAVELVRMSAHRATPAKVDAQEAPSPARQT